MRQGGHRKGDIDFRQRLTGLKGVRGVITTEKRTSSLLLSHTLFLLGGLLLFVGRWPGRATVIAIVRIHGDFAAKMSDVLFGSEKSACRAFVSIDEQRGPDGSKWRECLLGGQ